MISESVEDYLTEILRLEEAGEPRVHQRAGHAACRWGGPR